MVTGARGVTGAAVVEHVMEVRRGAIERVTTPDLPMAGEPVLAEIRKSRDAGRRIVLVS